MVAVVQESRRRGALLALASAFRFGASTPIAKLLLGITDRLLLAGLLYLSTGASLALPRSQDEVTRYRNGFSPP